LLLLLVFHAFVLQGSVRPHLRRGGTYNHHIIANCHRVCRWKNSENRSIIGKDMDKSYGPRCTQKLVKTKYMSLHIYDAF